MEEGRDPFIRLGGVESSSHSSGKTSNVGSCAFPPDERSILLKTLNRLDRPTGSCRRLNLVSERGSNQEGDLLFPAQAELDKFEKQDCPTTAEGNLRPWNEKWRMTNPKEKKHREVKSARIGPDGQAVVVIRGPAKARTLPAPGLVRKGESRTKAASQRRPPAHFSGQKTGQAPNGDEEGRENND